MTKNDTPKINLKNGTLHFTENGPELKQFDKQNGLTYQLDYEYDLQVKAPVIKNFIEHVLPDKCMRKLIFQYIGYVFMPHLNHEKVLFLYGGGANGKSVFLNIIKALVGKEQCCSYSLEDITKNDYHRAEFANYLLNFSTEISPHLRTSTFKQIASREPLSVRSPFGTGYCLIAVFDFS
ncbi:MAG: DUF5906 domain-containing protein [Thermoguttaceae bacterium]